MSSSRIAVLLSLSFAQPVLAADESRPEILYDLPVVEAPFNARKSSPLRDPSMQQSAALTRSLFHGVHGGLQLFLEPEGEGFWFPLLSRATILAVDYSVMMLPGFEGWLHEEWHRAVMSHRGVASYNEILDWPNTDDSGGGISVSHETDEDLARMKRESNSDFVRLQSAGWEAEWELARQMRRDVFFENVETWDYAVVWLANLSTTGYLSSCVSGDSDSMIDEKDKATGRNVARRDFTGPDCTGWVYDLFRPSEPYEARGVHPSGVGVDRYRKRADLTADETAYLRRQRNMAYLNFVDPMLVGIRVFSATNPWTGGEVRWNAQLQHTLTSFGGNSALSLFFSEGERAVDATVHLYQNRHAVFPGLELRLPGLSLGSESLGYSPRLMAWSQPRALAFEARTGEWGGLAGVRTEWRIAAGFVPYMDVEAKSQGWVAGTVDQGRSVLVRIGVSGKL